MQNKNQVGNNHDRSSQRNTPERTDSNHSVNISSYDTPERNNNQESLENCAGIDENANGQLSTSGNGQENLRTTHKLNDVTDVQILAKMQEESEYLCYTYILSSCVIHETEAARPSQWNDLALFS